MSQRTRYDSEPGNDSSRQNRRQENDRHSSESDRYDPPDYESEGYSSGYGDQNDRDQSGRPRMQSGRYDQQQDERNPRFGRASMPRQDYDEGSRSRNGSGSGYGSQERNRNFGDSSGRTGGSSFVSGQQRDPHRFRGVGPKGYERTDGRLKEQVCDALADDNDLDASGIEVKVASGEVTLDGQVDSRQAKRHAEDCVEAVSGVKHCQNNLRVAQNGQSPDMAGNGQTSRAGKTKQT